MNEREIRGYAIISKGDSPQIIDGNTYYVPSQSGKGKYRIFNDSGSWSCSCPDFQSRGQPCKHIHSVIFWLKLRQKTESKPIEVKGEFCPFCHSTKLIRRGIRKNQYTAKQRYSCKNCGKRFVIDQFKRFKGDAKTIALVMDLYFKGISLRKIRQHLNEFYGMKIGHVTIYRWITRFMKSMNNYVSKFKPELGDVWQADEQCVKARNKEHERRIAYTWNVLDADTRFLIANQVTEVRSRDDAVEAFRRAERNVGKVPKTVITDAYRGYGYGIREGFSKPVEHHRYAGLTAREQNNKIERFHNTFRERDKVMRGFKSPRTAGVMAEGFKTYYNFLRPHTSLGSLTPAQRAGIDLNLGTNPTLQLLMLSNSK